MGLFGQLGKFLFGSKEKHKRVSTLLPGQEDLLSQLMSALQGRGGEGAFGQSSDYYRDILEDNPELMEQFFAPEMRNFNENIIPGLAEQFAGMGSGGLSSSGFRNAGVQAGTNLQERLAAMRANLKQGAASGLSGLGQTGLGNFSQDVMTQPGSQGLFGSVGSGLGNAFGQLMGGFSNPYKMGSKGPYG
jgi:hypothetical protein